MLLEPVPVPYAIYGAVIKTLTELKRVGGVDVDHSDTVKFVQETICYREWGELATRYRAVTTP
jgi:hypothetical protein